MRMDDNDIGTDIIGSSTRSYSEVLNELQSPTKNQRDPRSIRLAAVTTAVVDVATATTSSTKTTKTKTKKKKNNGNSSSNQEEVVAASKVYASTVTALEGTLQQKQPTSSQAVFDSLSTQVALLDLMRTIVPYVTPIAIVSAALPVTSRVLRGIVSSSLAVEVNASDGITTETKDELGGINAVLRMICRTSTEILKLLSSDSKDDKIVRQLFHGTLLALFHDHRPKVRKVAHHAICELLMMEEEEQQQQQQEQFLILPGNSSQGRNNRRRCHPTVVHSATQFLHKQLLKYAGDWETTFANQQQQQQQQQANSPQTEPLHLLTFLQRCIAYMDLSVLGVDVMELLTVLLQLDDSAVGSSTIAENFVSQFKKDSAPKVRTIHALLAVVMAALEGSTTASTSTMTTITTSTTTCQSSSSVHQFAPRVLASLLQVRTSLVFREGAADAQLLQRGRTLYGQVVLKACELVMASDVDLACKLLPLSIQCVLQLSRPRGGGDVHDDGAGDAEVVQTLLTELTVLFRTQLAPWLNKYNHNQEEGTKALPTELEACIDGSLRAFEQVLQPSFQSTWSVSLKTLAVLLEIIQSRCDKVPAMIESMLQLRNDTDDDDTAAQRAIEDAVGSLCQGLGIEEFWMNINWTGDSSNRMESSSSKKHGKKTSGVHAFKFAWILPVLKTASTANMSQRPHLSFFQKHVLSLARQHDALTATKDLSKQNQHQRRVVELWSLFPCFCRQPLDIDSVLPSLSLTLVRAMDDKRYPQLLDIICTGLTTLTSGVHEKTSMIEENGTHMLPQNEIDALQRDATVVSKASTKLLPALFKKVESLHTLSSDGKKEDNSNEMEIDDNKKQSIVEPSLRSVPVVVQAIAGLAKHAPTPFLQSLFQKLMHRLLEESQQLLSSEDHSNNMATKEKLCSLLNLSYALLVSEALDQSSSNKNNSNSSVSLLYRAVKPMIRNYDYGPQVQKACYKVLAEICRRYHSFITQPETLKEFLELLTDTGLTSQVSSRHLRLKCMNIIVVEGQGDSNRSNMDTILKMSGEALMCLKDSNRKTREAAYQLILSLANAQDDMTELIRIITAALGAETPHMRSAAVMALSRIVFEHARENESLQRLLPDILRTVLVLVEETSREVIKSVVGFSRVSVAAMRPDQLEPLLPELVECLLKYQRGKGRFRAKIKIILKKLLKLYGYDTLMPLVPESESRLLTHLRKLSERDARRKAAARENNNNNGTGGNDELLPYPNGPDYDEMIGSDEDDSDDGVTLLTGATGLTRKTAGQMSKVSRKSRGSAAMSTRSRRNRHETSIRVPNEKDGEIVEILGSGIADRMNAAESDDDDDINNIDSDDSGAMEFDEAGRLVVHDEEGISSIAGNSSSPRMGMENDIMSATTGRGSRSAGKRRRLNEATSSMTGNNTTTNNKRDNNRKKNKNVADLGATYKSKKAGGDVKKKGQKFEPYAYVPLDGRSYSKKHRRRAVEQMETVVRTGHGNTRNIGKRKRRN